MSKIFDPGLAQNCLQLLVDKLTNAINKGIKPHAVNGRLLPDDQWAVRIIQSRIRLLDRLYDSRYGDEPRKSMAQTELSLAKQDDGTLLNIEGRNHSQGRLDCQACACDYSTGFPVSKAKICPSCNCGVFHCSQLLNLDPTPTTPNPVSIQPGGSQVGTNELINGTVTVLWVCDNCSHKLTEESKC